ncbi:MAG: hypothetical protein RL885_31360 [Planctomycetota bacterium]
MSDESLRCSKCDSERVLPGGAQFGLAMFSPLPGKAHSLDDVGVPLEVRVCLDCGLAELHAPQRAVLERIWKRRQG